MDISADISPIAEQQALVRRKYARPRTGRSKITNGKGILPAVDGRTSTARRYRDIANSVATDQGGADRCSEARKQLIRRFAAACVLAEAMESKFTKGEPVSIADYATLSNTALRIASRIGIDRVPRDVTPDLAAYLNARYQPEDATEGEEGERMWPMIIR